ncbi:MAG: serine hydrolase [Chitinophagales bacterium]|nr:serine hydrolase [Chitinophagales bacterium]
MVQRLLFAFLILGLAPVADAQNLYFPPKTGTTWQTIAPADLGFCQERIDSLYQFLEDKNTKSFILLKDGKIVLEKYFGTFVQDSVWYWASAGKSLSSFLVGQAQEEGLLDINDKTSQYLGQGWTSAPPEKEDLITIRNQLTMTNGLNDEGSDDNCTQPSCLTYLADAGTRWDYHNAPYHLIHNVLEEASGVTLNNFTKTRVLDRTGMKGFWFDHIMYSRARDMARYGLLILAKGVWNGDTLLHDQQYFYDMTHSSQDLNKSYGYLWWLNGQPSFMLPDLQVVFPFKLLSNAPDDMFAALGKNDQKIHIVPSKGWVVVRQGDSAGFTGPGGGSVPIQFDNALWEYLNLLDCGSVATNNPASIKLNISPNPTQDAWQIQSAVIPDQVTLYDATGKRLQFWLNTQTIPALGLPQGHYWLQCQFGAQSVVKWVVKG